jgi:hypothetical protein
MTLKGQRGKPMALIKCYECGSTVSDQAAACPKCGAPLRSAPSGSATTASPGAKPTATKSRFGCAALFVVVMIVGLIGQQCEKSRKDSEDEAVAAARDRAATSARAKDSNQVRTLLAKRELITPEYVLVDSLIHANNFQIPHDSIHRRTVQVRLDSAIGFMNGSYKHGKTEGWLSASLQLDVTKPPYTAAQKTSIDGINSRVTAQKKRVYTQLQAELRRQFATSYERQLLDGNMDATVTTAGANATTLRVKWILVSRVLAYKMSQQPDFFDSLRKMGFKRFEITDGYDDSWYWDL